MKYRFNILFILSITMISALGTGSSNLVSMFVLYRILGGLGIGMASVLSPIYIAEIAPAHMRGRFVILVFFIPESPRWLLKANQRIKARKVLSRIAAVYRHENHLIPGD